MTATVQIGGL